MKINTDFIYPVGSIYISINSTNPSKWFGGTWVAFGSGRTLVGLDTAQTEFNTINKTGGTKTHNHKIIIGQATYYSMPMLESSYGIYTKNASGNVNSTLVSSSKLIPAANRYVNDGVASVQHVIAHDGFSTEVTGYTHDSSNLPPYIVVYMWRRTA